MKNRERIDQLEERVERIEQSRHGEKTARYGAMYGVVDWAAAERRVAAHAANQGVLLRRERATLNNDITRFLDAIGHVPRYYSEKLLVRVLALLDKQERVD